MDETPDVGLEYVGDGVLENDARIDEMTVGVGDDVESVVNDAVIDASDGNVAGNGEGIEMTAGECGL